MSSKEFDNVEAQIKAIDFLYPILDAFASPYIEDQLEEPLAFYAEGTKNFIDIFIQSYDPTYESIIGDKEIAALDQLSKQLFEIRYFDKKEAFSKKQEWLDFVTLVKTVNMLLGDSLKRCAEKTIEDMQTFILENFEGKE